MSNRVAFVFPGQGSQYVGMLDHYFSNEEKFNYVFLADCSASYLSYGVISGNFELGNLIHFFFLTPIFT